MEYQKKEYYGYECWEFLFENRNAIVVFPKTANKGKKWLLKTEYFYAFPSFELEMLNQGYHLAYLENITRWHAEDDSDSKERFATFLQQNLELNERCVPVGMSCGGMHAVYFAAKYPKRVAALYLDAPVLNLLSCPCAVGMSEDKTMYEEFVEHTGKTVSDMINYRNQPIDQVDKLIEAEIPVCLICGDSDNTVPYLENGFVLANKYNSSNVPFLEILKEGCGHHPHGLDDNKPLIQFISEY